MREFVSTHRKVFEFLRGSLLLCDIRPGEEIDRADPILLKRWQAFQDDPHKLDDEIPRHPFRQAVEKLQWMNLVTAQQGAGTHAKSLETPEECVANSMARFSIECSAAAILSDRVDRLGAQLFVRRLKEQHDLINLHTEQGDFDRRLSLKFLDADWEFHLALLEHASMYSTLLVLEQLFVTSVVRWSHTKVVDGVIPRDIAVGIVEQHRILLHAIERGNVESAIRATQRHLVQDEFSRIDMVVNEISDGIRHRLSLEPIEKRQRN
jgi:DNA-binding GntR family transcriptional regulator